MIVGRATQHTSTTDIAGQPAKLSPSSSETLPSSIPHCYCNRKSLGGGRLRVQDRDRGGRRQEDHCGAHYNSQLDSVTVSLSYWVL